MIQLTRLNHHEITVNSDLIECLECTPDTLVRLTNGETMMVLESVEQVVRKVVDFKRMIYGAPIVVRRQDAVDQRETPPGDRAPDEQSINWEEVTGKWI